MKIKYHFFSTISLKSISHLILQNPKQINNVKATNPQSYIIISNNILARITINRYK